MHYLSLLTIFKNETMNLKVWLDHYIFQGVEHFYLIDNGSEDNPMEILSDYIDRGLVTYEYMPKKWHQVQNYREMYSMYNIKSSTKWLIVCDLDEFIFGVNNKLSKVLKSKEEFREINLNWLMFGSDNLIEHPEDIRTSILHREPGIHPNTKYICQPSLYDDEREKLNVHFMTSAGDNDERLHGRVSENELIHLNHYPIQSLEYFQKVKATRGDVHNFYSENVRDMNYFYRYDKNANFKDETLKNIVENPPENY
jgi:hypothetical protein